jgi:hypothetical protein
MLVVMALIAHVLVLVAGGGAWTRVTGVSALVPAPGCNYCHRHGRSHCENDVAAEKGNQEYTLNVRLNTYAARLYIVPIVHVRYARGLVRDGPSGWVKPWALRAWGQPCPGAQPCPWGFAAGPVSQSNAGPHILVRDLHIRYHRRQYYTESVS